MIFYTITVAAILWWTFAVAALFALVFTADEPSPVWKIVAYATAWPVLLLCGAVLLPFETSRQLIKNIRNKRLMSEFEEFLREKHSSPGRILPKDHKADREREEGDAR